MFFVVVAFAFVVVVDYDVESSSQFKCLFQNVS